MVKESVVFPLLELLPGGAKERALQAMTMHEYARGETIYERGESRTDALFIFDGKVKFCAFGPEGQATFFFHRGAGEMFGYYAAITEKPQTVTTIAAENTIIGSVRGEDFMSMVLDHRDLSSYMLKLVTGILRCEINRLTHLLVMDAPLRVVAAILDQVSETGSTIMNIPARAELASRLGMTRETLARHLSSLAKQGLIAVDRDSIHVLDPQRLTDLIG